MTRYMHLVVEALRENPEGLTGAALERIVGRGWGKDIQALRRAGYVIWEEREVFTLEEEPVERVDVGRAIDIRGAGLGGRLVDGSPSVETPRLFEVPVGRAA